MLVKIHKLENAKEFINLISSDNLKRIINKFTDYGFELRIVGGAVRDWLLGFNVRDIDLATNALPDEIIYLCNEIDEETPDLNEMVAVHGIRHGTIVIAFSEDEQYEITSLDFNIIDYNGKLLITQTPDWEADARRRDFTVNALSMDLNGVIYDYVGGLDDLKTQTVRFIGDYKKRIQDNPILILRFFKLLAKFKNPKYNKEYIDYIRENLHLLKEIKSDTVKWFIANIKKQRYSDNAIKAMKDASIELDSINESLFKMYLKRKYII